MNLRDNAHTLAQVRRRVGIDNRQRALTALATLEQQDKKINHAAVGRPHRWRLHLAHLHRRRARAHRSRTTAPAAVPAKLAVAKAALERRVVALAELAEALAAGAVPGSRFGRHRSRPW